MTQLFISAWLIYAAIFLVMPFKIPASGNWGAIGIVVSFILITSLAIEAVRRWTPIGFRNVAPLANKDFRRLIWLGIILSLVGFAFLIYDRVVIQKIDFSHGLAHARAQWTILGEYRRTPSSLFSLLGYPLSSIYFVSLVMSLIRMERLTRWQLAAILIAVFMLAMMNSAITGGRSTLLLLVVFVVSAIVLSGPGLLRRRLAGRTFRRGCYGLAAVMLIYVVYVTLDRAANSEITMETYLVDSIAYLRMEMSSWYLEHLRSSALSSATAPIVYIGAYLSHSYAILCEIVNSPQEDKVILFVHWLGLMSKLGLVAPPEGDWFLAGRFPSVPGALWLQFGPAGLVVGSAIMGAVSGFSVRLYRASPDFLLFKGFQACCATILVLSPLMFAADLMVFPFIVIGFGVMAIAQLAIAWRRR